MSREKAIELLTHYINLPMVLAGGKLGRDNQAEIEQCVDSIIEAAVEETLKRLNVRIEPLERLAHPPVMLPMDELRNRIEALEQKQTHWTDRRSEE